VEIAFDKVAGHRRSMKVPNRSELSPITRTKAAVAGTEGLHLNGKRYDRSEIDGIWLVASLCIIGTLISIDFAAYFQVLDKLPLLVTQVP
jgi:hypothetical protein